jgi:catechol-2,3-dioxygenase
MTQGGGRPKSQEYEDRSTVKRGLPETPHARRGVLSDFLTQKPRMLTVTSMAHVAIRAKGIDRTLAFYIHKLGFEETDVAGTRRPAVARLSAHR